MQVFGHLGIDASIFLVSVLDNSMQSRVRNGVFSGEQRRLPATLNKAFGDIARYSFPRAILTGWSSPSYGRQHGNSFFMSRQLSLPIDRATALTRPSRIS